jgi:DNA ligase-1
MTEKYPDLVALIPHIRAPGMESFIMEGEVVAVDEQGSVNTFQTLAGRGKKNVGLNEVKVQVCLYAFDLMYLNGEVTPQTPLMIRVSWINRSVNDESY